MATLWKRATPSQYRMLRAIAGAVRNAAHSKGVQLPHNFERGVAKRAVGTLTAQWPDVLAAKCHRRQDGSRDVFLTRGPRSSDLAKELSKGGRLRLARRSPLLITWKYFADQMWKIRREGTPEQYAAYVRVLKLLDQAQKELDALAA